MISLDPGTGMGKFKCITLWFSNNKQGNLKENVSNDICASMSINQSTDLPPEDLVCSISNFRHFTEWKHT